jgi:hypothetical protein
LDQAKEKRGPRKKKKGRGMGWLGYLGRKERRGGFRV